MNKRTIGKEKEQYAVRVLQQQGYTILATNYWTRIGEIDIVAKENGYLVFIEVKYRKNARYGLPEEAVNYVKRNKIIQTARIYMMKEGIDANFPCRFDCVLMQGNAGRIIRNAFMIGE